MSECRACGIHTDHSIKKISRFIEITFHQSNCSKLHEMIDIIRVKTSCLFGANLLLFVVDLASIPPRLDPMYRCFIISVTISPMFHREDLVGSFKSSTSQLLKVTNLSLSSQYSRNNACLFAHHIHFIRSYAIDAFQWNLANVSLHRPFHNLSTNLAFSFC